MMELGGKEPDLEEREAIYNKIHEKTGRLSVRESPAFSVIREKRWKLVRIEIFSSFSGYLVH